MSYTFLQNYWWFIVSLLGAILVFLLFVQGANSVARSLGYTEGDTLKRVAALSTTLQAASGSSPSPHW